jgi:UDP-N-acetylmuramoyl-L-alanine---L-glutamate ligase
MIEKIINKKTLILGLGREGESSYRFLRSLDQQKRIGLADLQAKENLNSFWQEVFQKDSQIDLFLGKDYLDAIGEYEIIIRAPGVPMRQPQIANFIEKGGLITSETDICLAQARERIIGITGTKGKTTTATLLHHIIGNTQPSLLVGNMGEPVLNSWKDWSEAKQKKWLVYEMSSHQLDGLKTSPTISVFLNLEPDHLDYFENIDCYYRAKGNIARYQNKEDYLVYNCQDPEIEKIAQESKATKIRFSEKKQQQSNCFWDNNVLYYRPQIGSEAEPILQDENNKINLITKKALLPSVVVAKLLNVSNLSIKEGIDSFCPPNYRLEFIGKFKGIDFYNDSAATIPTSTIAAIESHKDRVETLIVGGSSKKIDFEKLAIAITESNIKNLIIMPSTGQEIADLVNSAPGKIKPKILKADTIEAAVSLAFNLTTENKICLFSPASASFNAFKNYQERGESFNYWVNELAKR